MGVYPGGAFQEEDEEDPDVKRMKAELGGESEDAPSPQAVGIPVVPPLRIGEGRNTNSGNLQQLSRVIPSAMPMSPATSAVLPS